MLDLAERHGDPDLLALRDQDVVQILLDTIYLRLKVDSDEIERIRCITEKEEESVLMSSLGSLTKSMNQQAFLDKHLKVHLAFIDSTVMPDGKSIIRELDEAMSFKDLLAIQLAPHKKENAQKIEQLCHMIIQN